MESDSRASSKESGLAKTLVGAASFGMGLVFGLPASYVAVCFPTSDDILGSDPLRGELRTAGVLADNCYVAGRTIAQAALVSGLAYGFANS